MVIDPEREQCVEVEEPLRSLIDNANFGMVLTRGNRVLYFNRKAHETLGYSLADLPTMERAFELFYPDRAHREAVMRRWFEVQLGPSPLPEQVERVRCKNGEERWISFSPPVQLPDGRAFTTFIDATAREAARTALEQRDRILDGLAKSARDFVVYRVLIDPLKLQKGVVEFVTDSARTVLGTSRPEDFLCWFDLLDPEDLPRVEEATQRSGATGAPFDEVFRVHHGKTGEVRWIHAVSNACVEGSAGLVSYTGALVDVTDERRAAEEQEELQARLQRARELEALGTLAAGIAHEFNNILMAIQGCVSLALTRVRGDERTEKLLREAEAQVAGGAELTMQILGPARTGGVESRRLDLREVVRETTATFTRTQRQVLVHQREASEPLIVVGDEQQLARALLNLFVNAADAMQGTGTLEVETALEVDPPEVAAAGGPRGRYARVEIRDEGEGMDEETQQHIFEPFFSTKPRGKGTGLGLAAVYGIVRGHGGYVDVASAPGRGSTFSLRIPLGATRPPKSGESDALLRGAETVLVVDDEAIIRKAVGAMLRELGYRVLEAASGPEALAIYRANAGEIDVVLLDLVMASMGGREVLQRLRESDPAVRVILSTGYDDSMVSDLLQREERLSFLMKPYDLARLSHCVRKALDRS